MLYFLSRKTQIILFTPSLCLALSSYALAQESGIKKSRFLEEVVVTAQKRSENAQDVPISLQAFSADALDARGISDQRDLQFVTPGLDVGTQVGYTTVFLRGVGSDAFVTADPSVALYIDGVYFPFAQGLAQDFGAVERVEILKGPQGTLFGRNSVGGAINVISESPQFDEFTVSTLLSYATFEDIRTRLHVNVPLTDDLAVSFSGIWNEADYYYDGVAHGESLGKETSEGGRIKIRWQPTDRIDVELAAFRLEVGGVGSIFQLNENPSDLFSAVIEPQPGYEGEVDAPAFTDIVNKVYYGTFKYFSDTFDTKFLLSKQEIATKGTYDFDGSNTPLVEFSPQLQYADVETAELQLSSNEGSWGSDWLEWMFGAYYYQGDQGFDPLHLTLVGLDLSSGRVLGLDLPFVGDILSQLNGLPLPTGQLELRATVDTVSKSAFFQTTVTFNDYVALTLGGRYQEESREVIESSSSLYNSDGSIVPLFNFQTAVDDQGGTKALFDKTYSFNPKISLNLTPFEDDTLIYASAQQATKSATYNALAIYLPPSFVRPEETVAYEIGIKTRLLDDTMTLNFATFQYDIEDLQVQFISLLQGGAVAFENAPAARSRGFDFDVTWLAFSSYVDDLVFTLSGAYLDAEYTDFPSGTGFNEGGVYSQDNDYTGNRIIRSPEYSAAASVAKTWRFGESEVEAAVDTYYNDGFFYAASNTDRSAQSSYQTFNARVSYFYTPYSLRFTIFGKNVTDEVFTVGSLPTDFGNLVTLAPPRVTGLRINWDY